VLDTNLKRTHKLATIIITFTILFAALAVTCLYPVTGTAMDKLRARYRHEQEAIQEDYSIHNIESNFVNYAMEASYYMFGFLLQECEGSAVEFSVLDEYGWDSDYHSILDDCNFYAVYQDVVAVGSKPELGELLDTLVISEENLQEMRSDGILAYLILEFDAYGKLAVADLKFTSGDVLYYPGSVYNVAKRSVDQYERNVEGYIVNHDSYGDLYQVVPKNFRVVFAVDENSNFVSFEDRNSYFTINSEQLFIETGVVFVILAIALFVASVALILPFFKKLHTGWESIFSIHIETVICLSVLFGLCAYGMMYFMAYTNMYEITQYIESNGEIEFLGNIVEPQTVYYWTLALSYLGWCICFFMEYVIFSAIRQFLSRPVYYLTHRFLVIQILKWMFIPLKKLYDYVTDINVTEKFKNSILKIVIANFVLVSILCCFWFFGIPGLIIYSIILYVLLKKYGSQLQQQYFNVINGAKQMAAGNLKVSLEEDLGIFEPIGEALEEIQQGFSVAVAEEAKSQQMKTELITNVSHDLKTPLTAIITYINLLKNPDISEKERESYIETLDQKTQRLKVLIEDLFEVSKAQSGNIQMNFMDVDVVSLMKQVRLEMEDQIADSELYFRWNLPEEKVMLCLDGQRTYRVFVNLLHNILKYSMPGSRVFIDIVPKETVAEIHFRNISMAELDFDVERLTDRFVRGDKSRNTEGSGLGLAIAKSFVELQNGSFKIDVDGDLFKVTIVWPRKL